MRRRRERRRERRITHECQTTSVSAGMRCLARDATHVHYIPNNSYEPYPHPTPLPTTYLIRLLAPDDLAALEHVFPRPRRHTQFGAAVACGVERVAGQPGVLAVGATRVRRHIAEVSGGETGDERPLPRRCSCRCVTVDLPLQEVRRISWGGGRGQVRVHRGRGLGTITPTPSCGISSLRM